MGRISQIEDRGAVIAWSPLQAESDLLAVGTKDSAMVGFDEDHGGYLEIYHTGITLAGGAPRVLGTAKTSSRFASLGWSTAASWTRFPMGLLAGGMVDGSVALWDPAALLRNNHSADEAVVCKLLRHHSSTAVSALQFNPIPEAAHLLATGGINGHVLINALEHPDQPTFSSTDTTATTTNKGEVTQVAWNTQVSHILAASYGNGTVTIWDSRQKKPWCELTCEANRTPVADMAWNPIQGLHLVTASADDRYPALKLWDLRSSTTMPLETIVQGHTQGILSLAWCPHDESLLLSSGKDNQTLLWDMYTLKPIADITYYTDSTDDDLPTQHLEDIHRSTPKWSSLNPTNTPSSSSSSSSSSRNKKRYHVQWSPILRGCAATCTLDRKIELLSILSHATKTGRPPQWMKPASGVSWGFGGTIVSFTSTHKSVSITNWVEQPKLKEAAVHFQQQVNQQDFVQLCSSKADILAKCGNMYDSQVWGILQVLFQDNTRTHLIQYLGLDADTIHSSAMEFKPTTDTLNSEFKTKMNLDPRSTSSQVETLIQQALIMGNFEAAVECCLKCNYLGDALILASCGGPDLWSKTQKRYFDMESSKRPFLSIVHAVMDNQLLNYVQKSDPSLWHETLAILCTYAPIQEFSTLCDSLGDLLREQGDESNASLCYMCAYNLDKLVQYWEKPLSECSQIGKSSSKDLILHEFIEKVTVYLKVLSPSPILSPSITNLLVHYAQALADQGLFTIASQYCMGDSREAKVLRDRLYRCKDGYYCAPYFGSVPEFPFTFVNVGVAPTSSKSTSLPHPQSNVATLSGVSSQRSHQALTSANTYNSSVSYQQAQPKGVSTPVVEDQLPPGWISLVDPASGMTYYANQVTGVTTWDRPAPPAPQVSTSKYSSMPQSYGSASNIPSSNPSQSYKPIPNQYGSPWEQNSVTDSSIAPAAKLASKYGDGFVTSASHPELAEQYGNIGTSNPYADARPGTAIVRKLEKPPVSGTPLDPNQLVDIISPEDKGMTDGLLAYASTLSLKNLAGTDQKLWMEADKSISIFVKRLAKQDISRDVVDKVKNLCRALEHRDFNTANAIQNELVNTEWREHKDWLKGMKFLIQLLAKYNY